MGNRISSQDRVEKVRSDAIDRQLKEDSRKLRKECKILLLGPGESGKSAIVKQMKIIHQNGFTHEELMTYRLTVYRNTLDSAQAIVLAMRKLGLDCAHPHNRVRLDSFFVAPHCSFSPLHVNADRIFDYRIDSSPSFEFSSEIAKAIDQLWKDPIIPQLMDHSSEFYLMDSAVYFFTEVLRIGAPKYIPTENDVLRARLKSTGITETRFAMGQLQIRMLDVGDQLSERKKWIHCFESVTNIIFCTALTDYAQVLIEAGNQNRMTESLILFESVINSRWFLRTSIILLLNKIDVFKAMLPKVPLERYFPEYTGGTDINKAAKYILRRFVQTNRARLPVYSHLTHATDTTNIHLISAAVKDTLLQNALKDSRIWRKIL